MNRAWLGVIGLAAAMVAGQVVGQWLGSAAALTWLANTWSTPLFTLMFTVALMVFWRRGLDKKSLDSMGANGWPYVVNVLTGFVVVAAVGAALVVGGDFLQWWHVSGLNGARIGAYLAASAAPVLLGQAAQQVALSGYAYTNWRANHGRVTSGALVLASSLLINALTVALLAASQWLVGKTPQPFSVVPSGQDPLTFVLLTGGTVLVGLVARFVPRHQSLWCSLGAASALTWIIRMSWLSDPFDTGFNLSGTYGAWLAYVGAVMVMSLLIFAAMGARPGQSSSPRTRSGSARSARTRTARTRTARAKTGRIRA